MKQLIKIPEMAKILGVTDQTVWRWVRARWKNIPFYGTGRTLRFDPEEVLAWFKNLQEEEPREPKAEKTPDIFEHIAAYIRDLPEGSEELAVRSAEHLLIGCWVETLSALEEGPKTLGALHREGSTGRQATQSRLLRMEAKGLVMCVQDGRWKFWSLTERGHAKLDAYRRDEKDEELQQESCRMRQMYLSASEPQR